MTRNGPSVLSVLYCKLSVQIYVSRRKLLFRLIFGPQHLDRRAFNLEIAHETLVRNDELIRELEYKHLATRHQTSDDLLRRQHQVELVNQREYMKHAEQEMKQRHLGESRQLPKHLKVMRCIREINSKKKPFQF